MRWFLFLLVAACSGEQVAPASVKIQALVAGPAPSGACVDPGDFGALPNDEVDDTVAIQAAIDAQSKPAVICLRQGVYLLSRIGGTSSRRTSSLTIEQSGIELVGAGWATTLKGSGDGGNGDWYMIHIKSKDGIAQVSDVAVRNMRLSGEGMRNTDEQTHLIQVGIGPVSRVELSGLSFMHPPRVKAAGGNEGGGDCVRLLGEYKPANTPPVDKRVRNVSVSDSVFIDCDRSSVGFQRGVFDVSIRDSMMVEVGDQHIDMELSGVGPSGRILMDGLVMLGGRQGQLHVSIAGNNDGGVSDVVLANSVLMGRGLGVFQGRGIKLVGNVIEGTGAGLPGLVYLQKQSEQVLVEGNTIIKRAGSPAGPVFKAIMHNSGMPGQVIVSGNYIANLSDGNPIDLESAQDCTVAGNELVFLGPTLQQYSGVKARATERDIEGLLVSDNRVRGQLKSIVDLNASPFKIGSVSIVGNMARLGVSKGLTCQTTGGAPKPIVFASNNIDGATSAYTCAGASVVQQYP